MTARWTVEQLAEGERRVVIEGQVDLADEQALVEGIEHLFASDGAGDVIIDLAGVNFIDSSGVRALLLLRSVHGERLRMGAISEPVRRVLEVAGIVEFLGEEES